MLDIELRDIVKVYPPTRRGEPPVSAVDGVSLSIRKGEIFFLLGPSGCGKTTLLRMLAGFVAPSSGRILFDGRDVTDLSPDKRDLAMVFQNYALWPHMTVARNVEFGPRMARWPRERRDQAVRGMLEMVGMADRSYHKPPQLSGGQQQRVALARALAVEPKGLLLDEPLSNLDAQLRARMRGEIRRLVKAASATAVYVTHDQEEALSMADRIALMHLGRVVQVGTPQEMYSRPASRFVAEFVGEANFLPAQVVGHQDGTLHLQGPAGALRASHDGLLDAGQAVTCCIRPEMIRLSAPGLLADRPNRMTARVQGSTYFGQSTRYELALPGGLALRATSPRPLPQAQVGQDVELVFAAQDVVVLTQ